jgi:hypothetical protein
MKLDRIVITVKDTNGEDTKVIISNILYWRKGTSSATDLFFKLWDQTLDEPFSMRLNTSIEEIELLIQYAR